MVSVLFVKSGSLKRKSIHKGIFAAALSGFFLRCRRQFASDPLASELFADKKILDAKPIAKSFARQSGELLVVLVFEKYANGNVLGRLPVAEIIFF